MRTWPDYAEEAEAALAEATEMDKRNHSDLARRRREEAAVLATLAIVAVLTE